MGGKQLNLPSSSNIPMVLSPPTPAQNARQGSKHKGGHDSENAGLSIGLKITFVRGSSNFQFNIIF